MKNFFKIFISLLLILIVLGGAVGLAYKFTDGFTKNPFDKPTNNPSTEQKQLVSTTIVSEKYGTFELPANNVITTNNCVNQYFSPGTDFNFIIEKEFEFASKKGETINETSKLVIFYEYAGSSIDDYWLGEVKNINNTSVVFELKNNKITLKSNLSDEQIKGLPLAVNNYSKLVITTSESENVSLSYCITNFYCENLFIYDEFINATYSFLGVIISDKGCPLTDYIYDEMIADSTTQIIYNYEEVSKQ